MIRIILVVISLLMLNACSTRGAPDNVGDVCAIFNDKPKWYRAAKKSSEKWGGPIHLPMAIMYQESRFKGDAKPPMEYFLGFIPKGRASDAYGYSQALRSTWAEYQKEIGSRSRDRDNFSNAYDFIQWYMHKTYQRNQVSKWDAYAQYLNYHEGHGGFARGSHNSKQWLLNVAKKVDDRSKRYSTQLSQCKAKLDKKKRGWF